MIDSGEASTMLREWAEQARSVYAGTHWWHGDIGILLLAVLLLVLIVLRRRPAAAQLPVAGPASSGFLAGPPAPPVDRWIAIGVATAVASFGVFGAWASIAPLTSASIAPGTVRVDSNRKSIQHLEGGMIREILVRDGDTVGEGQILIRLDDVDARANSETLQGQLDALRAEEARLIAQRNDLDQIPFPADLLARSDLPEVARVLEGHTRIFFDQERSLQAEVGVWRQRAQQFRAHIAALEAENLTLDIQLESLRDEAATASTLLDRGLSLRPRVLELERRVAQTAGQITTNERRIDALREQVTEAELQVTALRVSRDSSLSEHLRSIQTQVAELMQRTQKTDAQFSRRDILAPYAGVVVNLRYFTQGGVISPGAEVLDIVPVDDKLVIEARVSPLDIDIVRAGMPAQVRLVAFKQRTTPALEGVVSRISADILNEPRSGEAYFEAQVEVSQQELEDSVISGLHPGMPVEVAIVTGERTFLTYLTQPVVDAMSRAFREE